MQADHKISEEINKRRTIYGIFYYVPTNDILKRKWQMFLIYIK